MNEVQENWKWMDHIEVPIRKTIEAVCTCIVFIAYAFLMGANVDLISAISLIAKVSFAVLGVAIAFEIYSELRSRMLKVIIILVNVLHLVTAVLSSIIIIITWW